jgi:hypothetical protein
MLTNDEICLAERLLSFAYKGVQQLALSALERGLTTISDLWQNYAECLMWRNQRPIRQIISDTIICELEKPLSLR